MIMDWVHYEIDFCTAMCGRDWQQITTDWNQVTCPLCAEFRPTIMNKEHFVKKNIEYRINKGLVGAFCASDDIPRFGIVFYGNTKSETKIICLTREELGDLSDVIVKLLNITSNKLDNSIEAECIA